MYKIAVIPGDGTGPEVIREGLKVLDAVSAAEGFTIDYTHYDLGGERYLRTGEVLPDSVLEELRRFDAIYLGAIGHPGVKPGILEKGLLLRERNTTDKRSRLISLANKSPGSAPAFNSPRIKAPAIAPAPIKPTFSFIPVTLFPPRPVYPFLNPTRAAAIDTTLVFWSHS